METPSVNTSYSALTDAKLEVLGASVIAKMTNNPFFPGPMLALDAVVEAHTAYAAALGAAMHGSQLEKAIKDQRKAELAAALQALAEYVNATAPGNELALKSTGFTMHKTREPREIHGPIEEIKIVAGAQLGSIRMSCKRVKYATNYLFEHTAYPATADSVWRMTPSSKAHAELALERGHHYDTRITVLGPNDQKLTSAIVDTYVM